MWANIMKYACNRLANWPDILNCLRAIFRVFRNQTWMKTIADAIEDRHEGAQKELKSFKGSLAKWRYETVCLLIKECLRVRHIWQDLLKNPELVFQKFQAFALLQDLATVSHGGLS